MRDGVISAHSRVSPLGDRAGLLWVGQVVLDFLGELAECSVGVRFLFKTSYLFRN